MSGPKALRCGTLPDAAISASGDVFRHTSAGRAPIQARDAAVLAPGRPALDDTTLDTARRHLEELYDQHLAAEPASWPPWTNTLNWRVARSAGSTTSFCGRVDPGGNKRAAGNPHDPQEECYAGYGD